MTEKQLIKMYKRDMEIIEEKYGGNQENVKFDKLTIEFLEEHMQYRAIGTVDECREARERQQGKKYKKTHPCKSVTYYQCPCCNGVLHINENFCGECGQAILWETEE